MIQGTQDWLELRKHYITSTDAAVICEKNPWQTPYSLWREKLDLAPPKGENEAMRIGKEMEPIARDWFIKETGIDVKPEVMFNEFMMASLDGYSSRDNLLVEIKCSQKTWELAVDGQVPDYYLCQVQHQILTSKVLKAFYVTFWNNNGIIIEIERDYDFMERYWDQAEDFYKCLINYVEPKLCKRDYVPNLSLEWQMAVREYQESDEIEKRSSERKDKAKAELIRLAQDQNTSGSGLKIKKTYRQGNVDWYNIPEIKEIDLSKHRKPGTEYWSIYKE